MKLSLHQFQQKLSAAPPCQHFSVALSGGVDSVVLLHALVCLREQRLINQSVSAIHINHDLQQEAAGWQEFCEQFCQQLGVPIQVRKVTVSDIGSRENAARESRYEVFAQLLPAQGVLLLAHHLDDQLETLLLRLMRGAGVAGLAGMPQARQLGRGQLFRPLLDFNRAQIEAYARAEQLDWIEDPSNESAQFDRNYLRNQVLPLMETRWPAFRESWSKSLKLLQEAAEELLELANADLSSVANACGRLQLDSLRTLSLARQRSLLRLWLQQNGLAEPGWNQMQQLVQQVLVQEQGSGSLELDDCCLQVHAGELYALRKLPAIESDSCQHIAIEPQARLLPGNGYLNFQAQNGPGLSPRCEQLELRYRQGGESLTLQGRPGKTLKKLFQETGMPPWLRDRVPLLYCAGELVCVPGLGVAEQALSGAHERGYQVCWQPPEFEFNHSLTGQPLLRAPISHNPD